MPLASDVKQKIMTDYATVEGDTGSREDPAAEPVAFVQHPEEDVLGLDGVRPELADLTASVEEDLTGSCGEPIEHTRSSDTS